MKKLCLTSVLLVMVFVLANFDINANSKASYAYEITRYYETLSSDKEKTVIEITKEKANAKKELKNNLMNLKKKYIKYKDGKINQDELIEEIEISIMSIGPGFYFDDDNSGGSNDLLVDFNPNSPLTEVEVDQLYSRIIAYSQYTDGDISELTTYVSFDPESNNGLILKSTYITYSENFPSTYRDYMAIGYPADLVARESTINWTKSVDYYDGQDQKTYSTSGGEFDTVNGDTFEITDYGILWSVQPFSSYANYGYNSIGVIPVLDENGYMEQNVNLIKSTYILETECLTDNINDIFNDFNMSFWSDYQHTIEKISITTNLNIRAYIGVSSNVGFLGVSVSTTLSPDKSRRNVIQILHIE